MKYIVGLDLIDMLAFLLGRIISFLISLECAATPKTGMYHRMEKISLKILNDMIEKETAPE